MYNLPMLSLSMVSHELKNPLTLIQGTLQLIGCHYPEIQNDPLWTQVQADVHYMSKLLSEITSINSIQNINYSRVNIRQVLSNVVYSFSANSKIQGKNMIIEYETEIQWIEADELKIEELLRNLIQNAMDATDSGDEIKIIVSSCGTQLKMNVQDSGCGIDSERIAAIFEPFVTYKAGGTGLGLAIVKHIVEAHFGEINVFSKPFEGTEFVVSLPIKS